jgi:hypothetical protein
MNDFDKAILVLKKGGVKVDPALSSDEIEKAETFFEIKFHPDHRRLLEAGLVLGDYGYNWRDLSKENTARIRKMIDWPLEGILFDIEENGYWNEALGCKPSSLAEAKKVFTVWYKQNVPQLVPIYSHRYMSNYPARLGAPVYSVHQTDIVYYGQNIFDYLGQEFHLDISSEYAKWDRDDTPFWSKIVS